MPVRVLVVDDQEAIRRGVRGMIEGDGEVQVIAEAADGEEAIQRTKSLRPDLIIMDISMPVRNGLSAAAEIKRFYPDTRIVMFSSYSMPGFITAAKDLGLNGFVQKEDRGPGLLKAIDAVIHDQTYFPSDTNKSKS